MSKFDAYYCLECSKVFEKPTNYVEPHGEEYSGCPFCGGYYVQAVECDCCGSVIEDDYIQLYNGDDYCNACFSKKSIED